MIFAKNRESCQELVFSTFSVFCCFFSKFAIFAVAYKPGHISSMAEKLIKIYLLWFFFSQTVDKLKKELENYNISIIAVEGFEELGDVSFQMEKLKVIHLYVV